MLKKTKDRYGFSNLGISILAVMWALVIFMPTRGIFADSGVAIRLAEERGYSEIKIVKKYWIMAGFRGCGRSDPAAIIMEAKNSRGEDFLVTACVAFPKNVGYIRHEKMISGGEK